MRSENELVMADESILIVGEHLVHVDFASDRTGHAWHLSHAPSFNEAIEILRERPHHLVVIDAESLTEPIRRAVQIAKSTDPDLEILLVAPAGMDLEGLEEPQLRPAGLLVKPLERKTLAMAVESALVHRKLLKENRLLKRQLGRALSLGDWVGCTPESQEMRKAIATAALSTGPVLLLCEDGTGRRLTAELIHRHGRNPNSTFLPVEIPSLPRGELARLLEELATGEEPGRFPAYSSGTFRPGAIYFSELTALSPLDQKALYKLIGQPVPFRIIASADPSIKEAVCSGEFDNRLFDQLSTVRLSIPPLRKARGDIPVLVDHFLKRSCERFGLKPLGVPFQTIENYLLYDWPGNVAELSMVIERAVSMASAARFDGTTLPEQFCAAPSFGVPETAKLNKRVPPAVQSPTSKNASSYRRWNESTGTKRGRRRNFVSTPRRSTEKMKRHKILL